MYSGTATSRMQQDLLRKKISKKKKTARSHSDVTAAYQTLLRARAVFIARFTGRPRKSNMETLRTDESHWKRQSSRCPQSQFQYCICHFPLLLFLLAAAQQEVLLSHKPSTTIPTQHQPNIQVPYPSSQCNADFSTACLLHLNELHQRRHMVSSWSFLLDDVDQLE